MLAAQPFYMEIQAAEQPATLDLDLPETTRNARRRAFVGEYLKDLNGTQAAIRAGYSPRTAAQQAADLLTDPNVSAAVERGKAQRLSRINMTQDDVLQEMAHLANARLEHFVIGDDGQVELAEGAPDGAMAAIKSIKKKTRLHYDKEGALTHKTYDVEVTLWDKPGTLKLMGKHVGLFPDKVELTGKDGGPIELARAAAASMSVEELKERALALATEATQVVDK